MKRFLTPAFLIVVLAAILTACTNTSRLVATGLETEITSIERATDGTISASWQVKNSNVVSYLFAHVTNKIYLNGTYLGVIDDGEALPVLPRSNAGRTGKLTGGDAAADRVVAEAARIGSGNYKIDTQLKILIYDDNFEKSSLTNSGTVPVTAK